jgi:hypothetical protein
MDALRWDWAQGRMVSRTFFPRKSLTGSSNASKGGRLDAGFGLFARPSESDHARMTKAVVLAGALLASGAVNSSHAAGEGAISYHTARVDDLDIFYREAGPKDAPVVLLLHGFPSSSRMYQPLFESALAAKYHLIAPDIRGLGIPPGRSRRVLPTPSIISQR